MARVNRSIEEFLVALGLFCLVLGGSLFLLVTSGDRDNLARDEVATRSLKQAATAPQSAEAKPEPATEAISPPPAPRPAKTKKAFRAVKTAPSTQPTTTTPAQAKPQLDQALSLVDQGRWQEAEAMLQQILLEDPQNEKALSEMAMIQLIDKKDPEAALPYLEQSIKINPTNVAMMTEFVNASKATGRVNEAVAYLQELQTSRPSGEIEHALGRAYQVLGEPDKAVRYLQGAVANTSGSKAQVVEDLGDAYLQSGDNEKALEQYQQALRSQRQIVMQADATPEAKEHYHDLRVKTFASLMNSGRHQEAREIIDDLRKDQPETAATLLREWNELTAPAARPH